jgi:NADPH:quinone reductase
LKAVRFSTFADTLINLSVEQLPDPALRPGEVLIKVMAAGVNHRDCQKPSGQNVRHHPASYARPGFRRHRRRGPFALAQYAGLGSGGDIGFTRDGSHAEFLVIPTEAVSPKPGNLSFEQAACIGVNFLTAYQGLVRCARLRQGETLLLTGARGRVGTVVLSYVAVENPGKAVFSLRVDK